MMCGLVGVLDQEGRREIEPGLLSSMNEALYHRGPDEGGIHLEPGVGLAHRRLSIIDLSSGQQPLFNEDRSVVVIYNGEIYNFQELTKELTEKGHIFRTRCDTEVIVHAWEEWGEHCVQRFRGMFAFALWDRKRKTLFLTRDRLGIKPLYYGSTPDGHFVFASELKALQVHPGFSRDIDPLAVEDYFAYGYVPEPRTIFRGIYKLSPGYTLTIRRGDAAAVQRRYWDVPFKRHDSMSEPEAAEELIRHLKEAIEIRLISEVPLGAFLSGGVDSSAVVALMAGLSDEPVNTCSISFGDPKYNESEYADQVARRFDTNHYIRNVDLGDFSLVDRLSEIYDEPFADSSALPTYRVCELARHRVTVALSGDGGDENLAGYRRYRWHAYEERMRRMLPLGIRRVLFGGLGRAYPKADWAPRMFRAKTTFESLARDSVEGYFHSVAIFGGLQRRRLYSEAFQAELQGYNAIEVLRSHARRAPTDHPVSLVQYLDMKTYLVGDILTKVDRASMAHALEVRVPILDHLFVEWLSGLAPTQKLNGGEGKYLLKKAMEGYLPREILYRRKMGFAVPIGSWFRGPLRETLRRALTQSALIESKIFDVKYLDQLYNEHSSGKRDHSAGLWALLMFESFLKRQCS